MPANMEQDNLEIDVSPAGLRKAYHVFLMQGFTPAEAGNLCAKLLGLSTANKAWTIKELLAIEFLKALNDIMPL